MYTIFDTYLFNENNFHLNVSIELQEFKSIVYHFNLFNDNYTFASTCDLVDEINFLGEHNCNFNIELTKKYLYYCIIKLLIKIHIMI